MKDATQQMSEREAKMQKLLHLDGLAALRTKDETAEMEALKAELAIEEVAASVDAATATKPTTRRRTPKESIAEKRREKVPTEIRLMLHRETSSYTLLDSEEKEAMAKLDVLRNPDNYEIIIGRKLVAEINWK